MSSSATTGSTRRPSHWNRLRDWLDDDQDFIRWRRGFEPRLEEFESQSEDAGTLLRGRPLAEAQRWLADRGSDLSPQENSFISRSTRAQEKPRSGGATR